MCRCYYQRMTESEVQNPRIGIDLGGTKIEAIVLSVDGSIISRRRLNTPRNDYPGTLVAIQQLIQLVTEDQNLPEKLPIGIGTPGAVSLKTGLLMNCNSTCLNGKPLVNDLQALLGRPVLIANDADCFTLSEASDGAATAADVVFGVILGTGVGGGIVINQQQVKGVNAISGEWGHTCLPLAAYQADPDELPSPDEPRHCFCGRNNCVETWLAGPAFERSFEAMSGESLLAPQIIKRINSGDRQAKKLLDQYCNLLALALSNVINILDPGIIVLGGGMSNINQLYSQLPEYLPRYVFSDQLNTQIVRARFGDSSGVRGAAWLWS